MSGLFYYWVDILGMEKEEKLKSGNGWLPASIIIAAVVLTVAWNYNSKTGTVSPGQINGDISNLEAEILPAKGVLLPVTWGNLGIQMIDAGVIDPEKFESIYSGRGGLSEDARQLLYEAKNSSIKMTPQNAGEILNLLWALGLGNKNDILENGEMASYGKDKIGNFASTGGWSLSKGGPMDHYSRHNFITLSNSEQSLLDKVSRGIYRPCCGNSTHFPDCNHGMAMFGLLELMASQGVNEDEMYRVALQVNSYWFPETYLTIGKYMAAKNISWDNVDPKEILGASYSSAQGYSRILKEIEPATYGGGGGCGV
ncbi:MAG: hypothetical protein HYT12_04830 [Candidatus Liptonbacteria bacterium]|nr:hypothetical protein [Candidatus Liptonbacteria bacterium]